MTLAVGGFIRSAYRMPVEVKGSLLRTARKEYLSICKTLETKRVYSHFELGPDGVLQCVFSLEPGLLLGETVRDWLWRAMEAGENSPKNFLWCEKFGENEFALVYVMDGRIYREIFATPRIARIEAEQLVRRGRIHDLDFRIFLHGLEPAEVGLEAGPTIALLQRSIMEQVDRSRKDLPQASAYGSAISRISGTSWIKRALVTATVLAVVLLAVYYGERWFRPEIVPPVVTPSDSTEQEEMLAREYSDLLSEGDAGDILLALHGAIARFLTDSAFGPYWLIDEVQWHRGDSRLQIQAVLRKGKSPPEDEGEALSTARQANLRQAAGERGWTLIIDQFNGTFQLPVVWNLRTREEIGDLPRTPPSSSEHAWHVERLVADMKLIGVLEADGPDAENSVYHTQALVLKLSEDPWLTGETARWLSQRLDGSPLSLDAVSLQAVNGDGVFMDGTIRFRLVWRISDGSFHPAP